MPDSVRYAQMNTAELRRNFLLNSLFTPGVRCIYCDTERTVIGSVVPGTEATALPSFPLLRSEYFAERREIGVLNIGAPGTAVVDGVEYAMANRDCLYIGRGSRDIAFHGGDPDDPAKFYLLSYPAHADYPTTLARKADAEAVSLGTAAACNERTIYKYIHPAGIKSCQLVMGCTELAVGSVWNTMPAHTHERRSEVYLYFDLAADARVFHLMGTADETRHLVVADEQVVVSPSWSIHAGVGTARYAFCWGMGGENQDFADMDGIAVAQLL